MLPSPSLGPPLLSASWSPPLFCGIPEADDPPPELDAAEVEAGAEALLDELEELPPQPATARAITTRAGPRKWRGCFLILVFMVN